MLKNPASFVLASFRSSTYPRGYASGLRSLRPRWTGFLNILMVPISNKRWVSQSSALATSRNEQFQP